MHSSAIILLEFYVKGGVARNEETSYKKAHSKTAAEYFGGI